jgi:hypothetical protein
MYSAFALKELTNINTPAYPYKFFNEKISCTTN